MKVTSFSVVIPVYNEEANLAELLKRTLAACRVQQRRFEIILVDDGSRDHSAELISRAATDHPGEIVGVLLNRNYGQHAAVMAGFAQARGEVVITLDADLQNPPEEIGKLLEKADEGVEVVGTIRVPRCDTLFRRISSWLINRVTARVTGVSMHDYGCMLRAYRRHVVEAMLQCHEHSTFIPVLANSFARHTAEVEVAHAERNAGPSKYSVWKLVNLQFDLLTSMTIFPLRLLSIFGAIISAFGIGLGAVIIILRILKGAEWAAQGTFTLFAILFVFVGAQFVAMGLLGEYIGRTYQDVRGRPRYFVQSIQGGSQLEKG